MISVLGLPIFCLGGSHRCHNTFLSDFRLGSPDFFTEHSDVSVEKSLASYVRDFRLGSADFSYGSHSVLGLPIFLYEEVGSIMRTCFPSWVCRFFLKGVIPSWLC